MNPLVEKYLKEKYGDSYEADAQSKYDEENSRANIGQAFSGIGDAIAGNQVGTRDAFFEARRKDAKENTIGKLEKNRKAAMEEMTFGTQMDEAKRKADLSDPNSAASAAFRKSIEANFPKVAQTYGDMWSNVSAADQEALFKPLQLKEQIEGRKQTAAILANNRKELQGIRAEAAQQKLDEKLQSLKTPYGIANNDTDAKALKDAHESKKNFDAKLQEMIDLRTKHGGGTIWNRDDVGRGKQLSKDLLLEYKNMAKLGVLSSSDEAIINAIIPDDPLEYASPLAAIQGQDPILHKMQKFKGDSDRDFQTRLSTRLRSGQADGGGNQFPRTVRHSDGRTATVSNEQELREAAGEGFQ